MTLNINGASQGRIHELAKRLSADMADRPQAAHGASDGARRRNTRKPVDAAHSPATMNAQLAGSYQPISRAVMAACATYFGLLVGVQFVVEDLFGFFVLGGISLITAAACLVLYREYGGRTLRFEEIELRTLLIFGLIYLGLVAHHNLHLEPARLVYFTFLTLAVSALAVSIRLALVAAVVPFVTMMFYAAQAGSAVFEQYLFVGIAGGVVSFCMTNLMRAAIKREIGARILADQLRDSAQALADSDMLTGLPNRRHFFRELKKQLDNSNLEERSIIVGIIDLDGFKPINDSFGHVIGDKLLFEVGRRLTEVCGDECFVARLGGDEFALVTISDGRVNEIMELGERIRAGLSKPYSIVGTQMVISGSIGFVSEQDTTMTEGELLERADYALYRAKEHRQGIEIYSGEHDADRRKSDLVEHHLRSCNREEELYVVFQPLVDIDTGRTKGFEALARWSSPELGQVPPDVFIAAAEKSGLIAELTPLLLAKALESARDWPYQYSLSFNLSVRDISSLKASETIVRLLSESGFAPERVEFEVTETMVMTDFGQAAKSLELLRATGAKVALDDFGIGYSNFQKLDLLSISTVKIDRSFVRHLAEGERAGAVVRTMIDLCRRLGIDSVIEGVETQDELDAVRSAGARYVQGFYFSKPMKREDLAAFILKESTLRSPYEETLPRRAGGSAG